MKPQYTHHTLEEAEETLSHILDVIREGVWDWDARSGEVRRSPGWYRMLGYNVDSLQGDVFTWEDIIHPEDYPRVMEHFEHYITGRNDSYCIEYRCRRADGNYLWIEDRGHIVEQDDSGQVLRMIGSHLNIHTAKTAQEALQRKNELLHSDNITLEKIINERTDELRTLNTKLQEQLEYINEIATRDKLTSVYNRHMFEELLNKEMQRARRYTRPLSLVMVDADFFKEINDRYGHQTGDAVLKELAGMLVSNLRDSDIIARWGGEEFVAILPDTTQEAAAALAEALRVKIARSSFAENIQLTCSFGITSYRHSDTLNNLFARIDRALYRAKEYQRNNVQSE